MTHHVFKDFSRKLSTNELEDLYLGYKVNQQKFYMTSVLAIIAIALSIFLTFANAPVGMGFCILGIALGAYAYFQMHKNDLKQKALEELFQERGKRAVFRSFLGGFGGFSLEIAKK